MIGLIIGGFFGVIIMALIVVGEHADESELRVIQGTKLGDAECNNKEV